MSRLSKKFVQSFFKLGDVLLKKYMELGILKNSTAYQESKSVDKEVSYW